MDKTRLARLAAVLLWVAAIAAGIVLGSVPATIAIIAVGGLIVRSAYFLPHPRR
jgi:uncharacterized membrane protein YesL